MENSKFVSVSVLNNYIARFFEANPYLETVYLKGELSNFKWSGKHCYFSIKDETSEISAMMFYPDSQNLDFVPVDGMQIQVCGKVQVYPKRGTYSIIVKKISRDGVGILYQEFIELKEKLQKEGLFDEKYKKPIPNYPNVVAIITSPTGDAIHDIISTFNRRLPLAKLILYPALVQGRDAPADLVRALKKVYADNLADVLIIGRGGGSFEDLSCFNDENLARTLFASPIPTITGIGHEADYTICDFVSSYRAPTPTGAAMRLTREKSDCYDELIMKRKRLKNSIINVLKDSFHRYQNLVSSYSIAHFDRLIDEKKSYFQLVDTKLKQFSPINQLETRYNKLHQTTEKIEQIYQLKLNGIQNNLDLLENSFKKGFFEQKINELYSQINLLNNKFEITINHYLDKNIQQVNEKINKLVLLNPFNTMKRGYAIITQNNNIIDKIKSIDYEQNINIQMTDGNVDAKVIFGTYKKNTYEKE